MPVDDSATRRPTSEPDPQRLQAENQFIRGLAAELELARINDRSAQSSANQQQRRCSSKRQGVHCVQEPIRVELCAAHNVRIVDAE